MATQSLLNKNIKNSTRLRKRVKSLPLYLFLVFSFLFFTSDIEDPYGQTASNTKYIILMIADGWGAKHIEATNKYTGATPLYQTDPAWTQYWMSTFPIGGSYDTAQVWTDFNFVLQDPITDSAAAASALYTGDKTDKGNISVSTGDVNRLFSIGEKAKQLTKAVGAISTVPVSHATPGAWTSHNDARANGYAIADEGFFENPNTTGMPTTGSLYEGGHGTTAPPADVIIGDGRVGFVNSPIRDKLSNESGQPGKHSLVKRMSGMDGGKELLDAANGTNTAKLAGLFDHVFRTANNSDFDPENPTLSDSANAALTVLNRNPAGFVLMVEGGAVDWAGHANNMDNMVGEMIDFNDAVQTVIDWVGDTTNGSDWNNTLVIVTGDHETGYLTPDIGIFPNQPLGEVSDATLALEKIYLGSEGRRASWVDTNGDSVIDSGETVHWVWNTGDHSNSLIPLYTRGAGSELFVNQPTNVDTVRGHYFDNTNVFAVMNAALINLPPEANDDSASTTQDIPVNINVIDNDTDVDGTIDPTTVTINDSTNGTSVANPNGTVTFTPNAGFTGTGTFKYTVRDDLGALSNDAKVTVTVVQSPQEPNGVIDTPVGDQTINIGDSVNFTGTGTDPDNNLPITFLWDFGDPAIADSTLEDPGLITFNNAGVFTVTLTVTDSLGLPDSTPATLTVIVSPVEPNFSDDFSIDSTADYTVTDTWTNGGFGSFLYDSIGQRVHLLTGDNTGLKFSHDLPPTDNGSFSIDFLPIVKYPSNGRIRLRIGQDVNNYYQLRNTDGKGPLEVKKVIGGLVVDSAPFLNGYTQGTNYTITINFSPNQTTIDAFGEMLIMNTDANSITVNSFELDTRQQDAFYDNISYIDNSSVNQPPNGTIDTPVGEQTIDIGDSVNFTGTGTDPDNNLPITFLWDFGDPAIADSTLEDPGVITFNNAGVFTVTLTVTDSLGLSDSDPATLTINVGTSSFFDDFSINTTGDYTVVDTWTTGGFGSFLYNSIGQRVQLLTGDNIGLQFSHDLPPTDSGTFSIDFLPTVKYPSNGRIRLRIGQDANNYYQLRNTDGKGPLDVKKVIGGLVVDSVPFLNGYTQGTNYTITINFSPNQTTVDAFGNVVTINSNNSSIMVNNFELETRQQDAFYDNILYTE